MLDKVNELIAESLDVDVSDLTLETNIQEDLDADSVDIITLVSELEDEFDIEVPTEEIVNFKTVQDIVTYIEANQ